MANDGDPDEFLFRPSFWPFFAAASGDGDDLSAVGGRHHHSHHFATVFSPHHVFNQETDDHHAAADHPPLTLDLFDRRHTLPPLISTVLPEESRPFSGFARSGSPLLELGLRLRLGLGFDSDEDDDDDDESLEVHADRGSQVCDWTSDDFFLGRRSSPSGSVDLSRNSPIDFQGLRVVGLDSVSDSDEQIVTMGDEQMVAIGASSVTNGGSNGVNDLGCPYCCDLDGTWRDPTDDFEWEEVDGRTEATDTLRITFGRNEESAGDIEELDNEVVRMEEENLVRTAEWEFFLDLNNLGRTGLDPEDVRGYFFDDHEGSYYNSDYEAYDMLLWQSMEHDNNVKGGPPAAKSVVDNLPSVMLTKEDIDNDHTLCAVCKDGILVEDNVKKLPCSHHYHEDCILPWLGMRNTCPLCRFELPTDDPEYEKLKARRAAGGVFNEDEAGLDYGFEVLPDA